jgi:hypothetical protein
LTVDDDEIGPSDVSPRVDRHANRPCVYLDQWVWIRLAAAAVGRSRESGDRAALEAVRSASEAGVAFPLSSTHYVETTRIKSRRQRSDLASVMAEVSHCRTLRARRVLLRHQILTAMHEMFGRPTFRPERPEPLGVGVHWAFRGEQHELHLHGPDRVVAEARAVLPPEILCRLMQWAEGQFLAGPRDDEVEKLRKHYGYRPEATEEGGQSRLEWERTYVGLLDVNDPITRAELRVRVQAREVMHEHLDLLLETFHEYRLPFERLTGSSADQPGAARPRMIAFFDAMPTPRLAVDRKVELFRNNSLTWTVNDLHDVDAVSLAIPYCDVVVGDKATVDSVHKAGGDVRNGTRVISRPSELTEVLSELKRDADALGGDRSGWEWFAPGVGFNPMSPDEIPRPRPGGPESSVA